MLLTEPSSIRAILAQLGEPTIPPPLVPRACDSPAFEPAGSFAFDLSHSLHHSGGTICEPVDLPVNKRHLDMVYSHIKYSDKAFMGSVTHPDRARDSIEMAKILFGDRYVDPATGKPNTVILGVINANSPMTYDATMLGALKAYARANALWKKQLAEYVAPPLDPAVDEALLDFINRRKAAFPGSNV